MWTADGRQVIWTALPPGRLPYLVMRAADGTGSTRELFKEDNAQFAGSVSPQRVLAYTRASPGGASDVYTLPLDGDRKVRPFVNTDAVEFGPEFSPDGKWIAYVSDESGVDEVYVAPYPGPGGRQQVTGKGGASPTWSHDGRELFYQSSAGLFAVGVAVHGSELQFGAPHRILENKFVVDARQDGPRAYDVAPDGKRFLMFVPELAKGPAPVMHVLLNWVTGLKPESSSHR